MPKEVSPHHDLQRKRKEIKTFPQISPLSDLFSGFWARLLVPGSGHDASSQYPRSGAEVKTAPP